MQSAPLGTPRTASRICGCRSDAGLGSCERVATALVCHHSLHRFHHSQESHAATPTASRLSVELYQSVVENKEFEALLVPAKKGGRQISVFTRTYIHIHTFFFNIYELYQPMVENKQFQAFLVPEKRGKRSSCLMRTLNE